MIPEIYRPHLAARLAVTDLKFRLDSRELFSRTDQPLGYQLRYTGAQDRGLVVQHRNFERYAELASAALRMIRAARHRRAI